MPSTSNRMAGIMGDSNRRRGFLAGISLWSLCLLAACSAPHYDLKRSGESMSQVSMLGRLHDVAYVHPRLPAASTGLAPGDVLLRVNERNVTDQRAEEVMQLVRKLTIARIQPLQLEIAR